MSAFRLVNVADVKYDHQLEDALHRKYPNGLHPEPRRTERGRRDQIIFPVMPRRDGLVLLAYFDAFVLARDAGVTNVLVWISGWGSDRDLDEMVEMMALLGY